MGRTDYIRSLKKDQLEKFCTTLKIAFSESDTVDTLRRLASKFVMENKIEIGQFPVIEGLPALPLSSSPATLIPPKLTVNLDLAKAGPSNDLDSDFHTPLPVSDTEDVLFTDTVPQMLKLMVNMQKQISHRPPSKYDIAEKFTKRCLFLSKTWLGSPGPEAWDFLMRFEEYKDQYSPDLHSVFSALRDCLRGRALQWFVGNKSTFRTYAEFRTEFLAVFLPFNYERSLLNQIRNEKQNESENMDDFLARLRGMNLKLTRPIDQSEIIEIAISNAHPRYTVQFHLLPHTHTLHDLLHTARIIEHAQLYSTEYSKKSRHRIAATTETPEAECVKCSALSKPQIKSPTKQVEVKTTTSPYTCFNCQKSGHFYKDCPEPRKTYCHKCKAAGKTTLTCECSQTKVVASTSLTEEVTEKSCPTKQEPSLNSK